MAVTIPKTDDKTYADLRRELVSRIPLLSKSWTDHNASDPGIALLELLCAMGEMIIYRTDQIPESVYTNFLKMVIDRPEPVTVELRFTREAPSNESLIIAAGTQVTEDGDDGEVFETVREARMQPGQYEVTTLARHFSVVENDLLGRSDGTPNQSFALKHSPVLLDPERQRSNIYNPNPVVIVGGETWRYVQDLLEAGDEPVFTVEWLTYRVQFGDGRHGRIPPKPRKDEDMEIRCERYQLVAGKEHQVAAGSLTRIIRTAQPLESLPVSIPAIFTTKLGYDAERKLLILAGELNESECDDLLALSTDGAYQDAVNALWRVSRLQVSNPRDAVGGRYLFDRGNAMTDGLKALWEPERAIAARDFEHMIIKVFNNQNGSKVKQAKIKRVHARRMDDLGTVAVVVIPERIAAGERWPKPDDQLKQKLYGFLDKRRLITTRLLIGSPNYRKVDITITVVARRNVDRPALKTRIIETINRYFDPLEGGRHGTGWSLGRGVYRSEIFHLLSKITDIDYVKTVVLEKDASRNSVRLASLELPKIDISMNDVNV